MDIVEFLTARLGEEAALAQRLADRYVIPQDAYIVEKEPERAGQPFWPSPTAEAAFRNHPDPEIGAGLELVRMYSPARVLAEVATKRRILAEHKHVPATELSTDDFGCQICAYDRGDCVQYGWGWCNTVRLLAMPYADHLDYDPAWAVA